MPVTIPPTQRSLSNVRLNKVRLCQVRAAAVFALATLGLAALRSGEAADADLELLASLLNSSVAELRSSALEGVARIGRALAQDHDGALDGAAGVLAPYVVLLGTGFLGSGWGPESGKPGDPNPTRSPKRSKPNPHTKILQHHFPPPLGS